ncbi:sulfite exporter TauE/SafE family protein [Actinopolymorpha sp. B17G11]|uniref:sulfite exporter TauE/SafE family protein n=1 Tax=unclassified Actinopolymorpha TaxID=2627063 RepID=UPI0032D8E0EA
MDFGLTAAGLVIGFVVGLTGMGGGALMTPVLVIFFGVQPLAAVSSDLVASALMKPFGGFVHLRRGTVSLKLVAWLCAGSIPAAFSGVLILRALGSSADIEGVVKKALGVALLLAAAGLISKAYLTLVSRSRKERARSGEASGTVSGAASGTASGAADIVIRPVPTLLVGIIGGLVVGMTSVGSGSLMIIALLLLYPAMKLGQLVGTDLVQAVPLVAAAAVGHLLFGDFRLEVAGSLLLGAIPGVVVGAHASSRAPSGIIRRALALVLFASGMKMLGVPDVPLGITLGVVVVVGPMLWMWARVRHGQPALARNGRRTKRSAAKQEASIARD